MADARFVLGVDLDGCVADFYGYLRPIAAEWLGVAVDTLPKKVSYGLPEWNLRSKEDYEELHRFAVTQRELFRNLPAIEGAAATLRRLAYTHDIRIRIITHRLYIKYTHQAAVQQTTDWLDTHGIPYWDLCFMRDKGQVGASLYVEDSPPNIEALQRANKKVIIFSNSTNLDIEGTRANTWGELEKLVIEELGNWKKRKGID
jgi:5'(3')-deoxyribonucleotidase